jgi:hypothetical protein
VGISKKFYSDTFLCSPPTMKNFNNPFDLQSFVTFAFKTTAFVKLCLPAGRQEDIPARPLNPNFFILPLIKEGLGGLSLEIKNDLGSPTPILLSNLYLMVGDGFYYSLDHMNSLLK